MLPVNGIIPDNTTTHHQSQRLSIANVTPTENPASTLLHSGAATTNASKLPRFAFVSINAQQTQTRSVTTIARIAVPRIGCRSTGSQGEGIRASVV